MKAVHIPSNPIVLGKKGRKTMMRMRMMMMMMVMMIVMVMLMVILMVMLMVILMVMLMMMIMMMIMMIGALQIFWCTSVVDQLHTFQYEAVLAFLLI